MSITIQSLIERENMDMVGRYERFAFMTGIEWGRYIRVVHEIELYEVHMDVCSYTIHNRRRAIFPRLDGITTVTLAPPQEPEEPVILQPDAIW